MFCPKCGAKNPDGAKFCTTCGNLIPAFQPGPVEPVDPIEPVEPPIEPVEVVKPVEPMEPVVAAESVETVGTYTYAGTHPVDTPPADELERRFFGKKADYYLRKRDKMTATDSNTSWNWAAFLFSYFWAFYRKLYAFGGILLGIIAIISVLGCFIYNTAFSVTTILISLGISFFTGLVGNYIYLNHADKCLAEARQMSPQEQRNYIAKKGGTSIGPVILALVAVVILSGVRSVVLYQKIYDDLMAAYNASIPDYTNDYTPAVDPAPTPDPIPDPAPAPTPAQDSSTGKPSDAAIADALAEIVPPFIATPGSETTFDWYDGSQTSGYATVYPQSAQSGAFTISGYVTIVLAKLDDGSWFAENYDPQCSISYNYADEYYDNAGTQGFYLESGVDYGNGYAWTTVTPLNFAGGSDPTGNDATCYWGYSDNNEDGSVYMLTDSEQVAIYFDAQMVPVSFYLAG